jgi:hypothetical protein
VTAATDNAAAFPHLKPPREQSTPQPVSAQLILHPSTGQVLDADTSCCPGGFQPVLGSFCPYLAAALLKVAQQAKAPSQGPMEPAVSPGILLKPLLLYLCLIRTPPPAMHNGISPPPRPGSALRCFSLLQFLVFLPHITSPQCILPPFCSDTPYLSLSPSPPCALPPPLPPPPTHLQMHCRLGCLHGLVPAGRMSCAARATPATQPHLTQSPSSSSSSGRVWCTGWQMPWCPTPAVTPVGCALSPGSMRAVSQPQQQCMWLVSAARACMASVAAGHLQTLRSWH